jgi:surfeit locus 1 family protein
MSLASTEPKRSLLIPGLFTLVALAILIGLGTWQVDRLVWKEGVIARLEVRLNAEPASLPSMAEWPKVNLAEEDYRRIRVTGRYEPKEALIFRGSGKVAGQSSQPGYWVMGALRLADGGAVLVNRGFVPLAWKDKQHDLPTGEVTVTGLLRAPEDRNMFTPADNPASGQWYTRDPVAIAGALRIERAAAFSIDEEAHAAAPGEPAGGATVVDIPNNHLSYAVTWYGLALTLVGVFTALVWKRRRN